MRTLLDDAAPVEHDEAIHLRDGREPMSDRDHRLVSHERAQARLNGGFDFAVERRGRFVEYQDRRVLENDAGDGDALALAAGKLHAALADLRIIAAAAAPILKFKNKFMGLRQSRDALDLFVTRGRPAVANIGADRTVQER